MRLPSILKTAKKVPKTHWSADDPMTLTPKSKTVFILIIGLWIFGTGDAIIIASGIGVAPWTVLAQGITNKISMTVGEATFLVSLSVLLLWIPLRERLGIGTILNAILIAVAIDIMAPYLPSPEVYIFQIIQVFIGTIFVGIGSGMYLTSNLGPGPRDGLMIGLQRISNVPIGRVRAIIEITVLILGFYLGGKIGLGTVIFAIFIGPVVAISLRLTGYFGRIEDY